MKTNVIPMSRRIQLDKPKRISKADLEEKPKKKTKKSASGKGTSLVLPKKVKVQIEADFGKHAPRLIEMLEMDHTDGALTLLKKKLLQTSVGLLPHAERTVRESQSARGVYQFSTLVSQIREIMGDIEADRDRDLLLNVINERVLKPAFMDMAHEIVMRHFEFRKNLEQMVKPDEVQRFNAQLKMLAKDLAKDMQAKYHEICDGLDKALKN